jgi:hypothetical protein
MGVVLVLPDYVVLYVFNGLPHFSVKVGFLLYSGVWRVASWRIQFVELAYGVFFVGELIWMLNVVGHCLRRFPSGGLTFFYRKRK